MPLNDLYTRAQSLNSMRPGTGRQCRLNSASVTWSRGRRQHTSRAAEFRTRCSGAVDDCGNPDDDDDDDDDDI